MRSAVSKVVWRHRKSHSNTDSTATDDDKLRDGHHSAVNAMNGHETEKNGGTAKIMQQSPEQPQSVRSSPSNTAGTLAERVTSQPSEPGNHPIASSPRNSSVNALLLMRPEQRHQSPRCSHPDCPSNGCLPDEAVASLERRIQELETRVNELTQLSQHQAIVPAASPSILSLGSSTSAASPLSRLGQLPPPPLSPNTTLSATSVGALPFAPAEAKSTVMGTISSTVPPRYPTTVHTRQVVPQSPLHYRSIHRRDETVPHLESPAPSFSRSHRKTDNSHDAIPQNGALANDPDESQLESLEHVVSSPDATVVSSHKSSKRPAGVSPLSRRNLSLTLLFEGDHDAYVPSTSTPLLSSMTPAESQWLRPQLLQYQREQQLLLEQGASYRQHNFGQSPRLVADDDTVRQGSPTRQPKYDSNETNDATHTGNTDVSDVADVIDGVDTQELDGRTRSHSITDEVNVLKKQVRTKWLNYLNSVQEAAPDVDVQMEEFIQIPAAVEKIMGFGFCICVDSFLYMCTVLPIRFVWSCLLLLMKVLYKIMGFSRRTPVYPLSSQFQFHRRHLYQLIQVLILLVIHRYVLSPISIGKLYHWIRGQAMIKLYVVIAMVELCDRLLASLGQDCLDSMYWNTVSRPRSSRFLVSVIVVLVYAALHAIILFVHMATLNVAMNSADQALLTLLISGNYAEIKSTVFKKYNKAALFKITASDICERFKLALFLSLVLLLNICQGMNQQQFLDYVRICGLIWCAELAADWVKHSFISKFNFLPARVYPEYALLLAGDVSGIGHEGMKLDYSHAVVKRIGFAQIPLICVTFRMLQEAAKYARNKSFDVPQTLFWRIIMTPFVAASSPTRRVVVYFCVWVALLILKLILGRLLQRISLEKLYAAPEYSQLTPLFTKTPNPNSKKVQ